MMNQKGQGITEYGIVFLLGVSICILIWFSFGLSTSPLKIDSLVATRTQKILNSDPGDTNHDTNARFKQINKNTEAYKTDLTYKTATGLSYDILYRYEGRREISDGNYINGIYKVYTFALNAIDTSVLYSKKGQPVYMGSLGLMTQSYYYNYNTSAYEKKNGPGTFPFQGKDLTDKVSYVTGQDAHGTYKATFFSIDGNIYQIRDYGDNETVLTDYSGYETDYITAVTPDGEMSIMVKDLADKGNQALDYYLSHPVKGIAYN